MCICLCNICHVSGGSLGGQQKLQAVVTHMGAGYGTEFVLKEQQALLSTKASLQPLDDISWVVSWRCREIAALDQEELSKPANGLRHGRAAISHLACQKPGAHEEGKGSHWHQQPTEEESTEEESTEVSSCLICCFSLPALRLQYSFLSLPCVSQGEFPAGGELMVSEGEVGWGRAVRVMVAVKQRDRKTHLRWPAFLS